VTSRNGEGLGRGGLSGIRHSPDPDNAADPVTIIAAEVAPHQSGFDKCHSACTWGAAQMRSKVPRIQNYLGEVVTPSRQR